MISKKSSQVKSFFAKAKSIVASILLWVAFLTFMFFCFFFVIFPFTYDVVHNKILSHLFGFLSFTFNYAVYSGVIWFLSFLFAESLVATLFYVFTGWMGYTKKTRIIVSFGITFVLLFLLFLLGGMQH